MKHIQIRHGDDWEELWVDEELVLEDHRLDVVSVLRALNLYVDVRDMAEFSRCPHCYDHGCLECPKFDDDGNCFLCGMLDRCEEFCPNEDYR